MKFLKKLLDFYINASIHVALAVFAWEGQVDWVLGLTLAAGTSIGGWFASRWSVDKGDQWIRYFLVVTVCAMAVKLWFY